MRLAHNKRAFPRLRNNTSRTLGNTGGCRAAAGGCKWHCAAATFIIQAACNNSILWQQELHPTISGKLSHRTAWLQKHAPHTATAAITPAAQGRGLSGYTLTTSRTLWWQHASASCSVGMPSNYSGSSSVGIVVHGFLAKCSTPAHVLWLICSLASVLLRSMQCRLTSSQSSSI
eukprot:GHRR01024444.1.p1 GENE.GHRR01024444.1~~GHRR01024444.1.p1  ORF type:complete len:174 (-),score=37.21 GHRR01024444.1:834-1355(-)